MGHYGFRTLNWLRRLKGSQDPTQMDSVKTTKLKGNTLKVKVRFKKLDRLHDHELSMERLIEKLKRDEAETQKQSKLCV